MGIQLKMRQFSFGLQRQAVSYATLVLLIMVIFAQGMQ